VDASEALSSEPLFIESTPNVCWKLIDESLNALIAFNLGQGGLIMSIVPLVGIARFCRCVAV
jgi:hypothetical protein